MGRKKNNTGDKLSNVGDYRHKGTKRKNIPPAKIAAEGTVPVLPKIEYGYSPRRPPVLRFDATGEADKLPELLAEARKRKLTGEEITMLAEALRTHEPWLEWAGKRESEAAGFAVDPVALHIHERVSSQAILKVAARQDVERTLFGDPEQEYHEAVQFYRHDIDWTNRLILGDSLQVMASLAKREDLAGKVQMIYVDPPYGIKYPSNFQPEIGKRDVKDKETDLTREPEMVKAYRDTWHLGIHSYLSYLRDRLIVARELLADTGSVFVQISDENLHRVRAILDEVFSPLNYIAEIQFLKTTSATNRYLPIVADSVLWYGRDAVKTKYRPLYRIKQFGGDGSEHYTSTLLDTGERRGLSAEEKEGTSRLPDGARVFTASGLDSASMGREKGEGAACWFPVTCEGRTFTPNPKNRWKTNEEGMRRLLGAARILPQASTFRYMRFIDDFPAFAVNSVWTDVGGASDRVYVVQTANSVIQRCMMMTTEPGDLVLDPTCGSGTTAYVAEQWGRRWITIDTSRVAVSVARQRLLTAKFDYYRLRPVTPEDQVRNSGGTWLSDPQEATKGSCTFQCRTVPHITLKSIAQNQNLDPIFAKHEPILADKLKACNAVLAKVSKELRQKLELKVRDKERREGKRTVTDADRRRWLLPPANRDPKVKWSVDAKITGWYEWEVPFDTDPDSPKELQRAVTEYREAWRAKMDEVNACISANAEQEELVDKPEPVSGIVRVSGPFSVEAVQPPELSLGDVVGTLSPIGEAPEEMDAFAPLRSVRYVEARNDLEVKNVEAYLDQMTKLLRLDGVRFPNNKEMAFSRLLRITDASGIHAEGRWTPKGETDADADGSPAVGVVFGPQYGPFTVSMLEKVIKPAGRRYDDLVVAGFSFAPEVYDLASNPEHQRLKIHIANIRPDVNPGMNGLLKEQPNSQLFTVFGQPRTKVEKVKESDDYVVTMEGVDIYDPVNNVIRSTEDSKVAAWFIDGDYDGRTFCVTQAFFPDKSAWEKLAKALGGVVDADRFEALSGTMSLPFPRGKHKCVAVKVIDPRGNEVMQVHRLR